MLKRLFASDSNAAPARALYDAAVAQARQPAFYRDLGVPDTIDGRFELITLHVFLILNRLKQGDDDAQALGQAVFNAMFEDMDYSLRELGAGDMGVGPRVKRMAQAFYGRAAAYDAGLSGAANLEAAVRRNVFGTVGEPDDRPAAVMSDYIRREAVALAEKEASALLQGRVEFGPPPSFLEKEPGEESV